MQATKDQEQLRAKLRELEKRAATAEALTETAHADVASRPQADNATADAGSLIVPYSTKAETWRCMDEDRILCAAENAASWHVCKQCNSFVKKS